eukprot:1754727-Ditylum_brightwellii.AAC.1
MRPPCTLVGSLLILPMPIIFATMTSSSPNTIESRNDSDLKRHQQQQQRQEEKEILRLPPASSSGDDESIPKLKFGETLRLDELGPIIFNKDGSMR